MDRQGDLEVIDSKVGGKPGWAAVILVTLVYLFSPAPQQEPRSPQESKIPKLQAPFCPKMPLGHCTVCPCESQL